MLTQSLVQGGRWTPFKDSFPSADVWERGRVWGEAHVRRGVKKLYLVSREAWDSASPGCTRGA